MLSKRGELLASRLQNFSKTVVDSRGFGIGTWQRIDGENQQKSHAITFSRKHGRGFDSRRLHHSTAVDRCDPIH